MAVTFFSPYGLMVHESGFMYMIARYLGAFTNDVISLKCNGLFTICNKDYAVNEKRCFSSCPLCMSQNDELIKWSCIQSEDLSHYLKANRLRYIKEELLLVPNDELSNVYYENLNIYKLCKDSFVQFFGNENPDLNNKRNLQLAKKIMLSSIKMIEVLKKYYEVHKPEIFFIPFNDDFLTKSCVEYLKTTNKNFIGISWESDKNLFYIINDHLNEKKGYEIYIENIVHFRNDYTTWPSEFIGMLNDVLDFAGIEIEENIAQNI